MTEEGSDAPKKSAKPTQRRSRARRVQGSLVAPNPHADPGIDRQAWLTQVYRSFIAARANREYYRVILETAWPPGHGIPGPFVTESELRAAINQLRRIERIGREPDVDYLDVFRRVRELQGEEGIVGLIKSGKTYQLIDLTLAKKRVRRSALGDDDWEKVLERFGGKCANCRRSPPEVHLQQDHKVPRVRSDKTSVLKYGVDSLENWQPLCDECNNFKSMSCRGCNLDCFECPWAFPEKFRQLRISPQITARFLVHAQQRGQDADELINFIIEQHLLDDS